MKNTEAVIRKSMADIQAICRGKLSPRDYDAVVLAAKKADRAAAKAGAVEEPFTQAEVASAEDKKTLDRVRVLAVLERGETLTPVQAMDMGILRLGARIWDLRHEGHKIETRLVRSGRSRIAEYRLIS